MSATLEPPALTTEAAAPPRGGLVARAEGVELLGPVHGCGYRDGAALVRRADGQIIQLGGLMYGLLECADGGHETGELAAALSERLGRRVQERHVTRLAQKLAAQGLLAGSEHQAPPRRHPLLALRWKVLVTNPRITSRLTAPFAGLFHPWIMWPVLAAFVATLWFVLIHKGIASATAQAFQRPGLLLLVFALAVLSAGIHELGHAAACRYAGATPGGMGVGLYMVWPAFYTDVTDAYRLPRRDRLRIDLAGLYFNAVVAVSTMAVWLAWRADALLLLVGLQVLQMVKQLSPVIRADGYHILSDATGVPDLYAQLGPTLRRLLPSHRREPSALTGRARVLVTVWVLVIVPVLLALSLTAVLLMPRLATSAWDSGRHIAAAIPGQAGHGQVLTVLASLVQLLALSLPVAGTVLVTQRIVRTTGRRAFGWSRGRLGRQVVVALATLGIAAGLAWAWWPSGQYQPIRASQGGTLTDLGHLVSAPGSVARPAPPVGPVSLTPGRHLAMAMIPVDGASKRHPALFIVSGGKGKPPVAIVSPSAPAPKGAPTATTSTSTASTTPSAPAQAGSAVAFPFTLPAKPGPGGTQALAVNTTDGAVKYDVAYSVVTVKDGAPVTNTNSAYALASCHACTTVAVSFQVVLIVGQSNVVTPIDAAGALNVNCPACTTTAIADQLVIMLEQQPSQQLLAQLNASLAKLGGLPALGANGTPDGVLQQVAQVQQEVESELTASGLEAAPPQSTSTTDSSSGPGSTTSSSSGSGSGGSTSTTTPTTTTPTQTQTTTTPTQTETTTTPTQTQTTTTPTTTTTTPSQTSTTGTTTTG